MRKFRAVAIWTAVPMLTVAAAACGGENDRGGDEAADREPVAAGEDGGAVSEEDLVAAAEEEGEVMVYWEMGDPVGPNLVETFNETYPNVQADLFLGTSSEQLPRLDAERDSGSPGADVAYNSTSPWFEERSEAGDLVPIDDLPNAEAWVEATGAELDDMYTQIAVSPFSLLWNTEMIDEPFTELADIARPELAGQMGTLDMVSPAAVLYYTHIIETVGEDEIAAQGPWQLYPTSAPMIQAVASGEISATAFMSTAAAKQAVDQGLPVDYVVPSDGGGTPNYGGVLANAEHPNAARLWMNFIMSTEAQEIIANDGVNISPMGADLVSGSPDLPDLAVVDAADLSDEDYNARSQEYRQIFLG